MLLTYVHIRLHMHSPLIRFILFLRQLKPHSIHNCISRTHPTIWVKMATVEMRTKNKFAWRWVLEQSNAKHNHCKYRTYYGPSPYPSACVTANDIPTMSDGLPELDVIDETTIKHALRVLNIARFMDVCWGKYLFAKTDIYVKLSNLINQRWQKSLFKPWCEG